MEKGYMRSNGLLFTVFLLILGAVRATSNAPAPPPAPFLITLHVANAPGKDYFDLDNPHSSFDVTIKNVSPKPQIIWKDWCSNGYYAVSLSVTEINGKRLSKPFGIIKSGHAWAANFPDPQTLKPGEETERRIFVSDLEPLYNVIPEQNDKRLISGRILPRLAGANSSRFETITAFAFFDTLGFNTASMNTHYGIWSGHVVSGPVIFRTGL